MGKKRIGKLVKSGKIVPKVVTYSRKSEDKIQFIIDNYGKLNKPQMAEELNESFRWVKRQVSILLSSGEINSKIELLEKLSESDWTDQIKNRSFELRRKYLKTNIYIIKVLKEEFNFVVKKGTFQFWMTRFGCNGRSKQDWLEEFLPSSVADKLLTDNYKILDIVEFLKKEYGVSVSDDIVLTHIKKIGLDSQKNIRIKSIRDKSLNFSKEWISDRINGHLGINGLCREMGVSKTVVMRRIEEEGLVLIRHRTA